MGLDAQIIAIGPYSKEAEEALEYGGSKYYGEVSEGDTVVSNVFICCTSSQSHELADIFGVGAMELGKHHLNPYKVDEARLFEFDSQSTKNFQKLKQLKYNFYYLPNA